MPNSWAYVRTDSSVDSANSNVKSVGPVAVNDSALAVCGVDTTINTPTAEASLLAVCKARRMVPPGDVRTAVVMVPTCAQATLDVSVRRALGGQRAVAVTGLVVLEPPKLLYLRANYLGKRVCVTLVLSTRGLVALYLGNQPQLNRRTAWTAPTQLLPRSSAGHV